jgi:hypothetical protein
MLGPTTEVPLSPLTNRSSNALQQQILANIAAQAGAAVGELVVNTYSEPNIGVTFKYPRGFSLTKEIVNDTAPLVSKLSPIFDIVLTDCIGADFKVMLACPSESTSFANGLNLNHTTGGIVYGGELLSSPTAPTIELRIQNLSDSSGNSTI